MPPAAASASGAAAAQAASPVDATLSESLTPAPALAAKVSADDVLFVFARAVDGPRMPVAIVRKRVSDLPLQFRLDDSMAMSPAARLSRVRRVIVGARISHSGNAMPQRSDLQGTTQAIQVGASGPRLEIDQVIANQAIGDVAARVPHPSRSAAMTYALLIVAFVLFRAGRPCTASIGQKQPVTKRSFRVMHHFEACCLASPPSCISAGAHEHRA